MRWGSKARPDVDAQAAEDAIAASHYVDDSASDDAKDLFKKQAGLQAVRGLGVSLVIFHHMTGKMTNAAAVFDAFFVISGYLISMRLIMLAQTASIRYYFLKFYTFRIRRIFPAAIVTLVLTAVLANVIYLPNRAHDTTVDTIWAFFFMANWHFAHNAVDYFATGASSSPVLNFWSLSVEEQFYLAWPMVILIALFVARRRGRGTGVTPVALVIIAVSYVYGWWMSQTHPVQAYYDTFARVWDFGIGALMANISVSAVLNKDRAKQEPARPAGPVRPKPLWLRLHLRAKNHAGLISWVGVVAFILAMFFTPPLGYPVPSASFGLVGMGIIFYADTLKRDPNVVFAKARPFIWLGDISYSLYAVHFPIVIFAMSYLSDAPALMYAFDVAASLCAGVLMYHFVETPFRQSWKRNLAWFRAGGHQKPIVQAACLGMVAAVLFVSTPTSHRPTLEAVPAQTPGRGVETPQPAPANDAAIVGSIPQNLRSIAAQIPASFSDPHLVAPDPAVTQALAAGVSLNAWPSISNLARVDRSAAILEPCATVATTRPDCIAAPASGVDLHKVAVVLGDSTALAYWPMLRDALVPQGWTVVMFGATSCPAADVLTGPTRHEYCVQHHAAYAQVLAQWRPSLLVMASAEGSNVEVLQNGGVPSQERAIAAYSAGLARVIAMGRAVGATPLILSPPPAVYPMSWCDVAGSVPSDCLHGPFGTWYLQNATDRAVAASTNARYADLLHFFCYDLLCPAVSGGLAVRSDAIHLTPEYAETLAPSFQHYLIRQGLIR